MTMTNVGNSPYFELQKDAPYLALAGDLWGIYCEKFGQDWRDCTVPSLIWKLCRFNEIFATDYTAIIEMTTTGEVN